MPASIGVNMRVTGHYSQGGRKYMEDKFSVAYQQTEDEKDLEYAYFGIFDGHGGSEAADFAKEHLMDSIVKQKQFWSENDDDVLRAIRNGYMMTHMNMWKELDKWPKTVSGLPSTAGTTASIAFIRGGKIYIGHVGDSAIVLGYQVEGKENWCAKPLTKDHKPESSYEMSRIQSSGGKVMAKAGVHRVVWNRPAISPSGMMRCDEIPFLAVARSLGDLWSYNAGTDEFVVSPDPDVGVLSIDPSKFRCLIFGTDGLWNMVSASMAVQLVQSAERHNERAPPGAPPPDAWLNPSKILVDSALQRWSSTNMRADNTSVVTLMMDPPGPPRSRGPAGPAPHPCSPPIGVPEPEEPCNISPSPTPPAESAQTTPSRGLSIVTRFPEPRPPPPPPPLPLPMPTHKTLYSYATTPEEDEIFISNYGNPQESFFIARLLNKTQIRNSLCNVYDEISSAEAAQKEDSEVFNVTNNNIEVNPFRKTSLLQRPSAPSPRVETVPQATVSSVAPLVPEECLVLQPEVPESNEEKLLDTSTVQESIQINEVSSSSPVDTPPKRNRKPKGAAAAQSALEPRAPCRSLRSHDTPVAPPRPQTRLRGRPSPTPPAVPARPKHSESKVPVPVHTPKPNPQFEKVVILNRPKLSVPPSAVKQSVPTEEQKVAPKTTKLVPAPTKLKQPELKVKAIAPKIESDTLLNNVRVTRSKDNTPSAADILLKAVKDSALRKSQSLGNRESEGAVPKHKEEAPKPAIVSRTRNPAPPPPVASRAGGTFLRKREPALDNPESSKENILLNQSSSSGPLKSVKRRNSGGGLNDLEPKEKRRTRLDDKKKTGKVVEEQHQDISSTQQYKDTNFILGLRIASAELHSPSDVPNRRSLRNADDSADTNINSPKLKPRIKRDRKLQGLISDNGALSEVHSTTVNLENEPVQQKLDAASSRALRSKQDNSQKPEEKLVDKRSLRSTAERGGDVTPADKESRSVLRSRNSMTALVPRITLRRIRTPWGSNQRQSLRKRCTK